jgi:hypothetical protein
MIGGAPSEPRDTFEKDVSEKDLLERDVLEKSLEGLKRASAELNCAALTVLVAEDSFVEVAYPAASPLVLTAEERQALMGRSGPVRAEDPLVALLTRAFVTPVGGPQAKSFLLFPWQGRRRTVMIVFGFAEAEPRFSSVPSHILESVNLAALAAWSAKEIARLRAELRAVNGQFASRKMVERAKGILQTQHGMNEQQAYEYLRRTSRQRRVAMVKLAQDLVGAAFSR